MRMSNLALALVPLLLAWPPPPVTPPVKPTVIASLPELGQVMPCHADMSRKTVIASADIASGCEVVFDGIKFFVATTDLGSVEYISVSDPRFVTKEGGWGFHAKLPSGWEAAYAQGATMTDGELSKYASVQWLFKRK